MIFFTRMSFQHHLDIIVILSFTIVVYKRWRLIYWSDASTKKITQAAVLPQVIYNKKSIMQ